MPHNLDIEISALRKGWGEWCDDYQAMEQRLRTAVSLLFRVHAAASDLGADEEGAIDVAIHAFLKGSAPPDIDPTPWCSGCGAMRKTDCHCGPIAENE